MGILFSFELQREIKNDGLVLKEGEHTLSFKWLSFNDLEKEYFYSEFIKKEIFSLPQGFKLITENE